VSTGPCSSGARDVRQARRRCSRPRSAVSRGGHSRQTTSRWEKETGITPPVWAWSCTVVIVTVDEAGCREWAGRSSAAGVTNAAVKKGIGRSAPVAVSRAPPAPLIEDAARRGRREPRGRAAYDPGPLRGIPPWLDLTPRTNVERYRYRAGRWNHRLAPASGTADDSGGRPGAVFFDSKLKV